MELLDACRKYKLDILGVSETWLKEGQLLDIPGFRWVGIAGENQSGKGGGVGFLVKDALWETVAEVVKVSKRILGLYLKVGKKMCWVYQVYAPVNDAPVDIRMAFWSELRDEVERRRKNAEIIVMGNLN